MDPLIKVEDVSVMFGDRAIIQHVNLRIDGGEFVSIVGRSGIGKTTLIKAILRFIPFVGRISSPRERGVIFQQDAVFPWMTVSQNITFGLNHKLPTQKKHILQHYLRLTDLETHQNHYPYELSGGQQQRTAIARAFAPNPSFVVMDEPFASLDIHTRDHMRQWLQTLTQQHKKTILFVTHYLEEAIILSDRILVLNDKGLINEFPITFPKPRNEHLIFTKRFQDLKLKISKVMHK